MLPEELRRFADSPEKSDPEVALILREALILESQGKLDATAEEDIRRRIQELSNKQNNDIEAQISAIDARSIPSKPLVLPKQYKLPVLMVIVFVVFGALLEAFVGKYFIFSAINEYWRIMPWAVGILAPLFTVGLFFIEKNNQTMKTRYPTWTIRWLLMFPLTVAAATAMTVIAPLGWSALYGWSVGTPSQSLDASVLKIRPASHSRWCDQRAELSFRGATASICVEDRISGISPMAGDKIAISGRLSTLGLFVEQIRKE